MKGISLPVNVIVILSLAVVVLLGVISFFSETFYPSGEALKEYERSLVERMTKRETCRSLCKDIIELEQKRPGIIRSLAGVSKAFQRECKGVRECEILNQYVKTNLPPKTGVVSIR